jgi:CubicO group peptidase (beta-lactamase class C family)
MKEVGLPGASLAVIRDNKVVYSKGYGIRNVNGREKVNSRTVFEACSLSKNFLTLVAHKLAETKELDLDRPLFEYLEYEPLKYDDRYRKITASMVLSHTSGLENWQHSNDGSKLEIVRDPGTAYVYSGSGFVYLSKVIEKITGKSYLEYCDELIFEPNDLRRAFPVYEKSMFGLRPANYATGHSVLGAPLPKWKPLDAGPAGAMNVTAVDHAKLVIATFATLSKRQTNELIEPMILTYQDEISRMYFGKGFEVIHQQGDTLVGHLGFNPGFKSIVLYSVTKRSGVVFFGNGEAAEYIYKAVIEAVSDLDFSTYERVMDMSQYPSDVTRLVSMYRKGDETRMFEEIGRLARTLPGVDMSKKMNELAWMFFDEKPEISRKIAQANIPICADCADTYYLLGNTDYVLGDFESAYANLARAQDLKYEDDLTNDLLEVAGIIQDRKVRAKLLVNIQRSAKTHVEAEDYNSMKGVKVFEDTENKSKRIGQNDPGDWLEYRVNVDESTRYLLEFHVASPLKETKFQVILNTTVLGTLSVTPTTGWTDWRSISIAADLPAGGGTLRIKTIGAAFDIDSFDIAPVPSQQ